MRNNRPTFEGELEPVGVNVQTLTDEMQSRLASLFEDELHGMAVDVTSRPTLSPSMEWRLNVPSANPRLYVAVSTLVERADFHYRPFVELGTMEPRELTVSVWCANEAIIGSSD